MTWKEIPGDAIIHSTPFIKEDLKLVIFKPATNKSEQRHLQQFHSSKRKPEEKTNEKEKEKETDKIYSKSRNSLCAVISILILFVTFGFLIYLVSNDKSYQERLSVKIRNRYSK